ncbi:MAG: glutamyl-tRNA reductase [Cytophagales bacterium]|nr:glutamyl-tRNA reductase [Cytophagales bacterium]
MSYRFKAISISYKHAPVEVREQVALEEQGCRSLLRKLKEIIGINEALVLSTCNRTELYYCADQDLSQTILPLIYLTKDLHNPPRLKNYFTVYNQHEEAIKHLFRVSIGLEARVVGDMQVYNQVKKAYQLSSDEGLAGPFLHRLMHTIFFSHKRVVQETAFKDGVASVSYATVALIEDLATTIKNPVILIIGLGEIGAAICKNLASYTHQYTVIITNRTEEKAITLAKEYGLHTIPFENRLASMRRADIIVTALRPTNCSITTQLINKKESLGFKYFIDLSVPRSISPEIEKLPGTMLYNIDDIKEKASKVLEKRRAAIPAVEAIIEESSQELAEWEKEMLVSPTIRKLKKALEDIRKKEIALSLKELNEAESEKVDKITKRMMQKIIKFPILQLKAVCKRGKAETLVEVLHELFDLEKEKQDER